MMLINFLNRKRRLARNRMRRFHLAHPGYAHAKSRAWDQSNPEKVKAKVNRWRAENPDKRRAQNRKALYGITQVDYDRMLEKQAGLCAICHGPPVGKPFLLVDHCHTTGKVRGLLCQSCNVGMGHFRDDPGRLEAAAMYLRV